MCSSAFAISSLVAFFSTLVIAGTTFRVPPNVGVENVWRDNPHYGIGEAINITWESGESVLDLILEIQLPNEPDAPGENWDWITLQRSIPTQHYRWIVDLGSFPTAQKVLDDKGLVVLFLLLSPPGQGTSYIGRSHYFNVTDARRRDTSTLLTSATTSTPTSASTSTSSTVGLASISPASSTAEASTKPDAPAGDKQPSTLLIGAAVGGSLGGLLILGGFGLFAWWLVRKSRMPPASKAKEVSRSHSTLSMEKDHYNRQGFGPAELYSTQSQTVHEVP